MKLRDFLVAEDIRAELGNKHSVIGVFGDSIGIAAPALPAMTRLAFFIRLDYDQGDPESFSFEFKVLWDTQDFASFGGGGVRTPDETILTLPLVANVLTFPGSGTLNFNLRVTDSSGNALLEENLGSVTVSVSVTASAPTVPASPGT